jgi:sugar/nucleoside kinase (ribokinase family)
VPYDYTTVGHVTIDVLPDGSRLPGGSAFYSALQAARLGLRALIITRGEPREIERLLAPYSGELDVQVQEAEHTTTLQTRAAGAARRQRVLAWAGPIDGLPELDSSILHLAPVARETPDGWRGRADFVGLTPQGLLRDWSRPGAEISLVALTGAPPPRCDALVLGEAERACCEDLIAHVRAEGAVVAVTAGHRPTTVLAGEVSFTTPAPRARTRAPGEDLGAGDVFAAALFIALHEGRGAHEAAAFAGAAAALRVAGAGPEAIAGREEVERLAGGALG